MKSLTSPEILNAVSESSVDKASGKFLKLLILAVLAGAYIAFGAQASAMASFNLTADAATVGIGKLVSAAVFPVDSLFFPPEYTKYLQRSVP